MTEPTPLTPDERASINERGKETEKPKVCPCCQGEGKLWCAMCGTLGDHRSGGCPELKQAETPTPRTDAAHAGDCEALVYVNADFARTLERALEAQRAVTHELDRQNATLRAERDAARARVEEPEDSIRNGTAPIFAARQEKGEPPTKQ